MCTLGALKFTSKARDENMLTKWSDFFKVQINLIIKFPYSCMQIKI